MKCNIKMVDGSQLKDVNIFRNKELADSIVSTREEIEDLLNGKNQKTVYFSGHFIQGGLIPQKIQQYQIIDDTLDVKQALDIFIKSNNTIWDLTDTSEFIMDYRKELLKILR